MTKPSNKHQLSRKNRSPQHSQKATLKINPHRCKKASLTPQKTPTKKISKHKRFNNATGNSARKYIVNRIIELDYIRDKVNIRKKKTQIKDNNENHKIQI